MSDVRRNINVTAQTVNGKVEFTMSGNGVGGEQIVFNKNDTPNMKKNDRYDVTFTLIDETDLELRFVQWPTNSPEDGAMWVKVVTDPSDPTCPAPNSHLQQFKATDVTDTVLTVKNKDNDIEYLKFALNFVPKNGNDSNPGEYVQYDPIGDNQNGGLQNKFSPVLAAVIIVGVITVGATKLLGLW